MGYTKSEYEKQFSGKKTVPTRNITRPFHTNKSVQALLKVISGTTPLFLEPGVLNLVPTNVSALTNRMPEDFFFRVDYLTFECPNARVASNLVSCFQVVFPDSPVFALSEYSNPHKIYSRDGKPLTEAQRLFSKQCLFVSLGNVSTPDKLRLSVPGGQSDKFMGAILGGLLDVFFEPNWYEGMSLTRLDSRLAQKHMSFTNVLKNYHSMVVRLGFNPNVLLSKDGCTLKVCENSDIRQWKVYSYNSDFLPSHLVDLPLEDWPLDFEYDAHNVVAEQTLKRKKIQDLSMSEKLFAKDPTVLSDLWSYFESDFTYLFDVVRDLEAFQDFFDWLDPVKEEDELWKNGLQLAMDNRNGSLSAQDGSQSVSRLINMEAYPYFLAIVYLCFTKKPEPTKDEIHVHLNAADLLKCFGIQENARTLSHLRNKLSLVEQMSVETKTPGGKFNYLPLVRERVLDTHNSAMIIDKTSVSLVLSKKALRIILANTTVVSGSIFSDFLAAYNTEFEKRRGFSSVGKSRSRLPVYFYPMLLSALSLQNGSVNYTGPMGNVAHMRKFLNFLFKFLNDNSYLAVPAIESKSRGVTHKLKENTFKLPWKTK